MTKSKRNLLVSIFVLVLTVAIAGGSTFAWFTTNQRVVVDDLNMSVTTGTQGLYVSAFPDKAFKTSLNIEDLKLAGFDQNYISLDNVTSLDGMTMKGMDGATISHAGATGKSSYVQFAVYFRVTGLEMSSPQPKVNLENLALTSTSSVRQFASDFDYADLREFGYKTTEADAVALAKGDSVETAAAAAMRMSFATQAFNKTDANYYTSVDTARVWDPYYADANTFCGKPNTANGDKYDNKVGNFAVDYYNQLATAQGNTAKNFPDEGIAPTEKDTFNTNVLTFAWNPATGAWEGKLTVRIWIEGFDGDCINAILGDAVKSTMTFVVEQQIVNP